MTTITLKHPLTHGGEQVTELTFKRLTLKDLMKMDSASGELAKIAKLIESSAAQPPSVVQQIDAEDLEAISEVLEGFLPQSLKIGKSAESD